MIVQPFSFLSGSSGGDPVVPQSNLIIDIDPSKDVWKTSTYNSGSDSWTGSTPVSSDGDVIAQIDNQASYTAPVSNQVPAMVNTSAGARPTWQSGDTQANGKPYIYFDAAETEYMFFGSSSFALRGVRNTTIYLVVRPENDQGGNGGYMWQTATYWNNDDGFTNSLDESNGNPTAYTTYCGDSAIDNCELIENYYDPSNNLMIMSLAIKTVDSEGELLDSENMKVDNRVFDLSFSSPRPKNVLTGIGSYGKRFDDNQWERTSNSKPFGSQRTSSSGSPTSSLAYDGRVYRMLQYDTYHDDTAQEAVMDDLKTIYG